MLLPDAVFVLLAPDAPLLGREALLLWLLPAVLAPAGRLAPDLAAPDLAAPDLLAGLVFDAGLPPCVVLFLGAPCLRLFSAIFIAPLPSCEARFSSCHFSI